MPLTNLEENLKTALIKLQRESRLKGEEKIITGISPAKDGFGPRYLLEGGEGKEFLRMNSNSYLGLHLHPAVIGTEEEASKEFGAGPGAVRFISGTHAPHIELEERLARFHGREAAMIFSAAYAAVMGVLPQLITEETLVVSDALNHNCIINAIRLSRPAAKAIFQHLHTNELESILRKNRGKAKRAVVVTDGVFSMRGDHAPLAGIVGICKEADAHYPEGVITVVDDSHGVGAFGKKGRGTEEMTGAEADILVGTLGKALGVNGGYVATSRTVIDYLRETAPFYIYSNPITPSEAAAALKALQILDSPEGLSLLKKLDGLTRRFREGLKTLGFETIDGEHPVVPLLVRDSARTSALVSHLFHAGVLATGLNFPVVPKGDEEIRFQLSAAHTEKDVDFLLNVLGEFKNSEDAD